MSLLDLYLSATNNKMQEGKESIPRKALSVCQDLETLLSNILGCLAYVLRRCVFFFAVMKTLTIISTIFIPLTFITGVYGMNFEYMPELSWPFSYLIFWIFVIAMITSQLYYFHRLGWT
mmetsp:Transcript_25282/g.99851  ORF Transcript_25282/g.99851 Transcript_25282/m.99851 type:complete len:119 (-) Transcript_25282:228-584(-)